MGSEKDKKFRERVFDLHGEEYEVIGEYIKAKEKLLVKHNLCGNEYKVTPDNFINKGTRCPKCFGAQKKTNEEFLNEIKSLVGIEYDFLDKYENTQRPLKAIHKECGHIFKISPSAFIHQGQRCPRCAIDRRKKALTLTNNEFLEGIYDLVGMEYTFLEEYKGGRTKIKVRHNICGYEYMVLPQRFKSGNRCRNCIAISQRKTSVEFANEIKKLTEGEYEVVGEYKAARFLTEFRHVKCGIVFSSTPNNFLGGNRCPNCYLSKGEQRIADFLDKRDIPYKREIIFSDLRMESFLRYDFGIYDESGDLKVLIEYDGHHHFKPIKAWGGDVEFERIQKSDKKKSDYALKNNIPLKRIPYWEYVSIDKILSDFLDNNSLIVVKKKKEKCRCHLNG